MKREIDLTGELMNLLNSAEYNSDKIAEFLYKYKNSDLKLTVIEDNDEPLFEELSEKEIEELRAIYPERFLEAERGNAKKESFEDFLRGVERRAKELRDEDNKE